MDGVIPLTAEQTEVSVIVWQSYVETFKDFIEVFRMRCLIGALSAVLLALSLSQAIADDADDFKWESYKVKLCNQFMSNR